MQVLAVAIWALVFSERVHLYTYLKETACDHPEGKCTHCLSLTTSLDPVLQVKSQLTIQRMSGGEEERRGEEEEKEEEEQRGARRVREASESKY